MENYVVLRSLGAGSFGSVFLARHLPTGELVALKKVRIKKLSDGLPRVLLREVQALEKLSAESGSQKSRHVLKLREYFAEGAAVVLVMEYMIADLQMVIKSLALIGQRMEPKAVKLIMWMCISGIAGVHEQKVIHRDLKPSNLLFSPSGCLKIGDFGLARIHASDDPTYSHEVATRWYRSVELLFGARKYGGEVDMWAIGCIFYELLCGSPLFAGQNDIDQLYRVLKVRGTPDARNWPNHADLPDWGKIDFPPMPSVPLRSLVHEEVADEAVELLDALLTLNPAKRITAAQAMQHRYFDEVRNARAQSTQPTGTDTWYEETLLELATFPSLVRQWQKQLQESTDSKATTIPPSTAATSSTSAPTNSQPSTSTSSTSQASSVSAAQHDSDQLAAMHLSNLESTPLSAHALLRQLHQLPAHELTIKKVHQPFRLEDICS